MKVYHISSAPPRGGAARAGLRLHESLCGEESGSSTWLDVVGGVQGFPSVQKLSPPSSRSSLTTRLRRLAWRRQLNSRFTGAITPFSSPIGWGNFSMFEKLPTPDAWNLHWVSNFLDWEEMLPRMADLAPIVWTLHDLNPLMGIWHFEPSSDEQTDSRRRLEEKAVARKQKALRRVPKDRLTFVGPSRWIVEKCRQSPVTEGFSVEHIPYSLDTDVFCPRDRSLFRRMYEIPESSTVIGFVADVLTDPRKGMKELLDALQALESQGQPVHLMTVGNGVLPEVACKHSHLGSIHNDYLLSFFYSACDLFVCPSLQDNLPNTVLESIACGTPVIGFDTGGLPDMVQEHLSGVLARPVGDGTALGSVMQGLLCNPQELQRLRQTAREFAVQNYGGSTQAGRYMELYRRMAL